MHFYFYRDKAAGRSAKMIAGVVCTMNEANTKFHSRVVFEEQGKDFKQGIVDGEKLSRLLCLRLICFTDST